MRVTKVCRFCENVASVACIVAIVALSYSSVVPSTFTFDDNFAVLGNGDVDGSYSAAMWTNDFWGNPLLRNDSHKSYRPLTILSFRLTKRLWYSQDAGDSGSWKSDATPFHLENLVLHCVATLLVFDCARAVYSLGAARDSRNRQHVALAAALLFGAHPVNTEAVMSVVGRSDLLGAVFAFSAMSVFHRLAPNWTDSTASKHMPFSLQVGGFVLLVGLVIASILCKETSFMMLPVLAGYFVLLECSTKMSTSHKVARIPWTQFASVIGPLAFVAIGYLLFRHWITGAGLSVGHLVFRRTENPMAFAPKFLTRFLSKAHVHAIYTGKMLWPAQLSVDYSMDCIPLVESVTDLRNIRSVSLYFCLSVAFAKTVPWAFLRRRVCFATVAEGNSNGSQTSDKKCYTGDAKAACLIEACQSIQPQFCPNQRRLPLAFCLVWFIGFALPFSNVITDVGTCVAERLLYVPNVAFCYVFAEVLVAIAQRFSRSKGSVRLVFFWALVGATLAVYAIRTRTRCRDWYDEETLFEAAYTVCPRSIKVVQNFGTLHRRRAEFSKALELYQHVFDIDPEFCDSHYWVALTQYDLGRFREAWESVILALDCPFNVAQSAQLLQVLYKHIVEPQKIRYAPMVADMGRVLADKFERSLDGFLLVRNTASEMLSANGNATEALHYMEQARAIADASRGLPDQALCSMYASLAIMRMQLGSERAAEGRTAEASGVQGAAGVLAGLQLEEQRQILQDFRRAVEMPADASCAEKSMDYFSSILQAFVQSPPPISSSAIGFFLSDFVYDNWAFVMESKGLMSEAVAARVKAEEIRQRTRAVSTADEL